MYLIKVNGYNEYSHGLIKIQQNNTGIAILNYRNNTVIEPKNRVPQFFCKKIVFIDKMSFQQNHKKLGNEIHNYISNFIIKPEYKICCIGGESYMYCIGITDFAHYTNSKYIYNDCEYNNKIYKNCIENNIVDYNTFTEYSNADMYIINLSKLNINILKNIKTEKIIIISCNHNDFWSKIKYLKDYKLQKRKYFVCYKLRYFLTVNVFIKTQSKIISLGGNCAVSYNMKLLNLKKETYPFDWSNTNINKLNLVLENRFEDFDKITIKKFSDKHSSIKTKTGSYIIQNRYITFAHEVNDITELNKFKQSIINRINRFNNLINPIFVRLETKYISKHEMNNKYNRLYNNLKKYFHKFRLIVIAKNNPDIDNIVYIELKNFEKDWTFPNIDWKKIFNN